MKIDVQIECPSKSSFRFVTENFIQMLAKDFKFNMSQEKVRSFYPVLFIEFLILTGKIIFRANSNVFIPLKSFASTYDLNYFVTGFSSNSFLYISCLYTSTLAQIHVFQKYRSRCIVLFLLSLSLYIFFCIL